ncbi:PIG-L deacetylase family protein [Streptomyces sp. NBC_01601]|uniref:PIG-L deacetylase family protein n=1 Tax=Streptomyces sp. NBC_01601 TaxID=2975892 RepID=UPI002E28E3C8|nr:PIG-L deacetylase family protein [Streptomyces sp. NBC_01601]
MSPAPHPPLPSLLGVFGHPDDEALLAGGVLAQHAAGGAFTSVVTATWAPNSPRAAELADALAILGAGSPRMLGFADARNPDSAPGQPRLVDAPLDTVVELLVRHIRELRPDIVVTHDVLGQMTGHPDHRRTHQITRLAVEAAGLADLYPKTGDPWQPSALYAATHSHSGAHDLQQVLAGVGKSALTVPDAYVTTTVDVTPWLGQKWSAILAHKGEVARERPLPRLLSRLPQQQRNAIIARESFTRLAIGPVPGLAHQLTC